MPAPAQREPVNLRNAFSNAAADASSNISKLSTLFTTFKEELNDGFQLSDLDKLFEQITNLFNNNGDTAATTPTTTAPTVASAAPSP